MIILIYTEADLNGMSDAAIAEYLSMLAERLKFMSTDDHKPFAPVNCKHRARAETALD